MHYKLILISLIISFVFQAITAAEVCGSKTCVYGTCINFAYEVCNCTDNYATVPETNLENCNYRKKSQLMAFILESFVTFGAGHFYTEDFKLGFTKLFVWVLACFIFISIRFVANKENANSSSGVMIAFFGCFFCYIMVVWQIIDMILYGMNMIKDGNNIELISWK